MKKQGISALLVLLLLLLIPANAWADVIYPAPGELVVGEEVNHLLATLDPNGSFWTDPALLPEGLYVETEESEGGIQVYLRGVPTQAGAYDLVFNYSGTDSICTIVVLEQSLPEPTLQSVSVETLPEARPPNRLPNWNTRGTNWLPTPSCVKASICESGGSSSSWNGFCEASA